MNSNWIKNEDSTGTLTVVLEGDEWQKAQKKAFNKLKAGLNIKGFRKGQVPDNVAKSMLGKNAIVSYAAELAANDALSQGVEENNIELVASPTLDLKELTPEKAVLEFSCAVMPDVILGDYKNMDVHKEAVVVSEEEVENEIKNLQNRYADWVLREEDEPAEEGDQVTIDYIGFKDGEAFEGGEGNNFNLVLGSHTFIPGFEESLIGIKPEEEREITVTFPEDYPQTELAGQPVVFKVKAHDIKFRELPEANDELVARLKQDGVETLDKYKEAALERLTVEKEKAADEKLGDDIVNGLLEAASLNVPAVMVENEMKSMERNMLNNLASYFGSQVDLELYAKAVGTDVDTIRASWKDQAEKNVKASLILEAVADAENIEITDEVVEEELKLLSDMYQMPVEQIKAYLSADAIRENLKKDKAMALLKEIYTAE